MRRSGPGRPSKGPLVGLSVLVPSWIGAKVREIAAERSALVISTPRRKGTVSMGDVVTELLERALEDSPGD